MSLDSCAWTVTVWMISNMLTLDKGWAAFTLVHQTLKVIIFNEVVTNVEETRGGNLPWMRRKLSPKPFAWNVSDFVLPRHFKRWYPNITCCM